MGIVKTFREFINESAWGEMRKRSTGTSKRAEDIIRLEDKYKSKFDICLKRFVNFIVYYEKYDNTLDDIIRFIHEDTSVKIWCEVVDGHTVHFPDIIEPYIKDNWNRFDNIEKQVRDLITEEEKKISETGFKKEPGKTIADTVDTWWDTLDDGTKYDTMMNSSMLKMAEDEFYETHLDDDEFTGEDLDLDDMYNRCPWSELVQIYMDKNTLNESAWGEMRKRSSGVSTRKEDDIWTDKDDEILNQYEVGYAYEVIAAEEKSITVNMFCDYIKNNTNEEVDEIKKKKIIQYITDNWGEVLEAIYGFIDQIDADDDE